MPTQLELEAQHRQEASQHNAQILEAKVTRAKADMFDGTIPVGRLPSLPFKADLVNGKVPESQLPSYVDDVLEFANLAGFPATGESGKIYIAIDTKLIYRWSGSQFVNIPTMPEPLFSEVVNLTVQDLQTYDFSQYENKTLNITISGIHSEEIFIKFPTVCRVIFKANANYDTGFIRPSERSISVLTGVSTGSPVSYKAIFEVLDTADCEYIIFYNVAFGGKI